MCATPNTSSPSATWGPRETVFSSFGALTFLGGYTRSYIRRSVDPSSSKTTALLIVNEAEHLKQIRNAIRTILNDLKT